MSTDLNVHVEMSHLLQEAADYVVLRTACGMALNPDSTRLRDLVTAIQALPPVSSEEIKARINRRMMRRQLLRVVAGTEFRDDYDLTDQTSRVVEFPS